MVLPNINLGTHNDVATHASTDQVDTNSITNSCKYKVTDDASSHLSTDAFDGPPAAQPTPPTAMALTPQRTQDEPALPVHPTHQAPPTQANTAPHAPQEAPPVARITSLPPSLPKNVSRKSLSSNFKMKKHSTSSSTKPSHSSSPNLKKQGLITA